ncbi:MAG: glycosyltransferase family 39 protein [Anaerolineaceae bacterium]|nr:glycosyltransferase family 39 protein [Anaerolineaceae bacterium]
MPTVFAWIVVGLVLVAAYPAASWLLARSPRREEGRWLVILLALALAVGSLTLIMFWEGLLGIPLTFTGVTVPYFLLMLLGGVGWWRVRNHDRDTQSVEAHGGAPRNALSLLALLPILLVVAAVLLNAVYWPFSKEDALAIYHRYGAEMAQTGELVPFAGRDEAFYQAYPIQISLTYTYAFLASGWTNEYLARLFPALLSLGCIPVVYLLGKALYDAPAGWAAALLLVSTETFGRWASAGYVDLPMAFFYTLAALFAYRLWQTRNNMDAALLGLMLGLAAWTKNAALMGLAFVALWLGWAWLSRRLSLRLALLVVGVAAAVAAPWYLRNWLEAGLLVPSTAWTDQAQRTLESLLILVARPQNYGLAGWVILVGVGYALFQAVRAPCQRPGEVLLLSWTLPFFAVWWLLVSYDPRFLLLFYPLLTVMGGGLVVAVGARLPEQWRRWALPAALLLVVILAGMVAWNSVEFKDDLLRQPLMSDAQKHAIVQRK